MTRRSQNPHLNPTAPAGRRVLLDGMRGIAAIAVLLYHSHHFGLTPGLVTRGYLLVDFFFLLSGFVLTIGLEPKLCDGRISIREFIWRRIRRLWPVLAVGVALGVLASPQPLQQSLILVPAALLLVPALSFSRQDGPVFPLNGPHWSLSWEVIVNVLHASLLARLTMGRLAAVVGGAAIWLAWAILEHGSNKLGMDQSNWISGLPRVIFSYGMGMMLGRANLSGLRLGKLKGRWEISVAGPLLIVVSLPYWPVPAALGDMLATVVILPALFAFSLEVQPPSALKPIFGWLGLLSYPLYAVHLPIISLAATRLDGWPATVSAFTAAIGVSALVAVTLERSLTRRGNGVARAGKPRSA